MKSRINNRIRLVKKDSITGTIYHCVSRTVNKEFFWDERAKEVLRRQIGKVAAFCGVDIISYCLMSNHFHLLVRVVTNRSACLTNEDMVEKLRLFYNNPDDAPVLAKYEEDLLGTEERRRENTRKMLLARMDDLSNFMKILKQRFSIWYNRNYHRAGPHWCDRFQSVLVQNSQPALRMVAAYIALNPVRAGICKDPKDYRYSSFAEALSGDIKALQQLSVITGESHAAKALEVFRRFVYIVGVRPKADGSGMVIAPEDAVQALAEEKEWLSVERLYRKAKCFTQGVAIGSADFLKELCTAGIVHITKKTRLRPILNQPLLCLRGPQ